MKVVIVKSQGQFDNLMLYLESTGTKWKWCSGHLPTKWNGWVRDEIGVGFSSEGLCSSALNKFPNLHEHDVISYKDFMLHNKIEIDQNLPKIKTKTLNKDIIEAIDKLYGGI